MTVLALRAKRSKRTIPGAVKWKKKKGTKDRKMFKKEAVGWVVVHDKRHKQNQNTENDILDVSVLNQENTPRIQTLASVLGRREEIEQINHTTEKHIFHSK